MPVIPGHASDRTTALANVRRRFRNVSLAIAILAVAFVLLAVLQVERGRWMHHGRTVARVAREAQWITVERQSALRGYLITRDPRDRAEFDRLELPASVKVDSLVELTKDNPAQNAKARAYRETVRRWEHEGAQAAISAPPAEVVQSPEADLFDSVRVAANEVLSREEDLYVSRVGSERGTFRLTVIIVVIALGVLLLGMRIIRKGMIQQTDMLFAQAEAAEVRNRLLIEQQERTAQQNEELRLQTEQLQEQAVELEEQEAELEATIDELTASEELFRTVVSSMTDIVYTLDSDLLINQLFGNGVTRERIEQADVLGRTPDDVFRASQEGVHHEASRVALAGESVTYTWDSLTGDRTRYFSSTVAPLRDSRGRITGVVGAARDITQIRERDKALAASEEKFRHAQKLEAVGQLAGGVAHDFNNLLTVIIAYASLLLADTRGDGEEREAIEEIKHAAERGAHLTRQLLAFSRQQVLRPELVDLNEVVTATERMLGRTFDSNIAIRLRLAEQDTTVFADQGQLEQILVNLSVNARDAMPAGGTLTLSTENVYLAPNDVPEHPDLPAGWYVALTVRDDGVGMTEETRARMFEPFFTTKPVGKGTGLGMSTVHGIVEQSGGLLIVTSEVGHGTTCRIILPRAADLDMAPPAVGEVGRGLTDRLDTPPSATPVRREMREGGGTILLVDDDDAIRSGVARLLARAGHQVIPAASALEALRLLEQDPRSIELVLTDMVMPSMSGRELAYEIRVRFPHAAIVLMSGYTKDRVLDDEVLGTETTFLHKPFSAEQLTRTVNEALAAARARATEVVPHDALAASADGRRALDNLMSGVDAIVWEAGARNGEFHYVNRRAESLVGYPVARWRDAGFFESILHPGDRARVLAYRQDAARTGASFSDEYRVIDVNGDTIWLHDLVQVVADAQGGAAHLRGIMLDITERKRSEIALGEAAEALERERTFLTVVLENLSDAVVACDENAHLTLFNAATRDLHGLPARPIDAAQWPEYYSLYQADGKTPMEAAQVPLLRALNGELVNNAEMVVVPNDGSPRSLLASGRRFTDSNGKVLGAVIAMRDVTEIKKSERELIVAKEQAERALRTKSEFLSLISHELRTPLTAVIGFAKVLRRNRRGQLSADDLTYVDRISTNGSVLLGLVNDLLELTQIESEIEPAQLAPVDLAEMARCAVEAFRGRVDPATLTLQWSAEPGVDSVPSDPVRLQSVLSKLIDNAIKFTPGGTVDVRALAGDGTQGPRIEVADTGAGIRADLIETIFAPFQQGEDFSRRQHGGTGLGLHLARRQCRMMRCRLTVASTEGQGTTFTIAFPAPAA